MRSTGGRRGDPRVMMGTLVVPVVVALIASLPVTQALHCRDECVVPRKASPDVEFCAQRIPYPACLNSQSATALDDLARHRFEAVAAGSGRNFSEETRCGSILQKFECMRAFPICQFGQDYDLLCSAACHDVVRKCASDGYAVTPSLLGCTGDPPDLSSSYHCINLSYSGPNTKLWVIGFLINLVFSFLAALGINLQKHSLHQHEHLSPPPPAYKQKTWVIGFSLILMGSILDFVAFGLAPQSFLAPLAALSLVWNMLLAPRFHGETITRQNVIATVIICVGVTSSVIFSTHSTPTYLLSDLIALYQKPAMYVYILCVSIFLGALYFTARSIERSNTSGGLLHIVCYGGLGGCFGGMSVTLAKSTVELIKSTFGGGDGFQHLGAYIIVAAMATCLLAQISFLNEGLRRFDALLVVPVYQAFWIIMSIMGGLVYFEEYDDLNGLEQFMFVAGALTTVVGIAYLLHFRRDPTAARASHSSPTPVSVKTKTRRRPSTDPGHRPIRTLAGKLADRLRGVGSASVAGGDMVYSPVGSPALQMTCSLSDSEDELDDAEIGLREEKETRVLAARLSAEGASPRRSLDIELTSPQRRLNFESFGHPPRAGGPLSEQVGH